MENLEIAKTTLLENDYSIVLVKENEIVNTSRKNGLLPILDLYNNDKSILESAIVADKVIGKAAALILKEANIKELYAKLISENAIELLDKTNIKYKYNKKVREIRNRDNTDICPMEELALESNNADELIKKIKEKFN
ncbi:MULTISPECIES: DUF1893 domain-containing protein [Anaerococcus]|uniref:DUF1893 domain-containing protein n=1 Tax=Anaerococcus octavius TaxID=54007 RepID=A0A2I1M6F3_9FIRM|nr:MULTISPECIES: DUF1893 domain-containing protein [Anaerococcus]MDU4026311.1 DUF1893 domain-containing protein [Anaerococcus sp.]PKZ15706.1 DUF1893 domain-containing protein [Anaerococcus octavius]